MTREHKDDNPSGMSWMCMLFSAIITLSVFWCFFAIFPFPDYTPNGMVPKILLGDLPDCNTTVGSGTGYYCQIANVSYLCKVDGSAADPFAATHPYCNAVVMI